MCVIPWILNKDLLSYDYDDDDDDDDDNEYDDDNNNNGKGNHGKDNGSNNNHSKHIFLKQTLESAKNQTTYHSV